MTFSIYHSPYIAGTFRVTRKHDVAQEGRNIRNAQLKYTRKLKHIREGTQSFRREENLIGHDK